MMPSVDELRRDFLLAAPTARIVRLQDDVVRAVPGSPAQGATTPEPVAAYVDAHDDMQDDEQAAVPGDGAAAAATAARSASLGEAVIAIGAFDGLHIGHRHLIERTVADARERGVAACVVTFDPDPDCVVGPGPAPKLMTADDRLRLLAASGVDAVVVVPFTPAVAALDHEGFLDGILGDALTIRAIHVGSDFRLGRGGACTVEVMRAWGVARGVDVHGHHLVLADGSVVSATRIRHQLAHGEVETAAHGLGRHFAVRGQVCRGRGQGTGMGFPTANIAVPSGLQLPADGVYAGLALVDGTVWPAAINVGLPPTFADRPGSAHLEANLIGFAGDVRGAEIMLAFTRFLRPSRVFDSTDELIATVMGNIDEIRHAYGESGVVLA